MKQLLPSRMEAAVFAALAAVCGLLAHGSHSTDVAMAMMAGPLFLFAGMLGMRKNWSMREAEIPVSDEREDADNLR